MAGSVGKLRLASILLAVCGTSSELSAAAAHGAALQHQAAWSSVAGPAGSDPTGRRDSSAALNAAIHALCDATADSPAPQDAVLDLQGGVYLLDSPLVVNSSVRCTGKPWELWFSPHGFPHTVLTHMAFFFAFHPIKRDPIVRKIPP